MMPKWVKKGEPAAVRGRVKEDYKRFDQKYHLMLRGYWDDSMEVINNKYYSGGLRNQVNKRAKGYARNDWAYLTAATALMNAMNFEIHRPNAGSNLWQPIPRFALEGTPTPGLDLPPWEGDAKTNTHMIKEIAKRYGASDVGICELDRRWVYSNYYDAKKNQSFPIRFSDEPGYEDITEPCTLEDGTQVIPKEMKYVIVFITEMHYSEISVAAKLVHTSETAGTYSKVANLIMTMAEFIRGLGYHAIPSANCTMQSVPAAIDAGMGETSRMGKLIHPLYGPRCRISKVITDLPLIPDEPISFGVQAFCEVCKRCAERCPGKAISMGDRGFEPCGDYANSGVYHWPMDHVKCKQIWNKLGNNCGICIQSCPYNKEKNTPGIRFARWLSAKTPKFNRWLVKMDKKRGYGKPRSSEEYWSNL